MKKQKKENPNFPLSVKRLSISTLLIMFLLTILSLFALPKLQTQYSLKQFLPKDNPLLKRDEHTRQLFQLSDSQPFIITAKVNANSETWFNKDKIESLERLTDLLAHFPGVRNTMSLATVQGALSSETGLSVGPLLKNLPEEKWQAETLANPLIAPTLISQDGKTASIIVNIKPLNTQELLHLRQNLEVTASAAIPFSKVEIGGTPAVQTDVGVLLQTEIRNFVVLGFIACFLVLGLVFANWSPLIISFIVILVANILVLAVMALAGYPFSILSSTIPILTTVDVVSLCIHTLLRYTEERKNQPTLSHHEVVNFTFKKLIGPNFFASTTTMIGFLALLTVKVPLIRDYGITASIAIMIGWLATTALLFPLLHFLPGPQARLWAWAKARWGLYLFRRSGIWAFLIVLVCSALAIKGQGLSWSARLFDDLPTNHQVRLSTETIDRELGGMIPIDIEVKGASDVWNDPKLLATLDQLLTAIRRIDGVGSVVGLPDLIAAANLHHSRLPASRSSTAEVFFLYSLSSNSPLKNFLNTDSSNTRISVRTTDLPANQLQSVVNTIKDMTEKTFPQMSVTITGMGSTIHHLNNELSHELIFGFWQSMAAICLVLVFVFKSLRWALVACIPNLVPPAALLGFLAISETPIKPSVAIIFSIALGLAFNNTVYLLERLRLIQKTSKSKELEIEKTLWREGNPCLISSLTLLAGFSVFMASYFAMNRIFGFYMLLSMLAGLVGDLILLPTMLKSCPWLLAPVPWKKEKAMATASAILLTLFISFTPAPTHAQAPTVEKIGQEMSDRLRAHDEEFVVKMKIIEADGSSKDREMKIWRLSPQKKEHYLMVRMQKPQDLKGTALLATLKGTEEDKWIYLPSTKQTRRLTGESGQGGILGSELSVEDFDFNREQGAQNTLKKEIEVKGKKYYLIESDVNATSSSYAKVISYVAAENFLPVKAECFDKQGKLLKVLDITGYKKLAGNKWRASKIKIRNVQNKRGTEITISQVKLDQNLKPNRFTPKALSEE
ncbi:outer membrane lipoprotein-sorting protein [Bdellovibrio sp. 22V]|uniref:outer membrane lipoprotein-sorting protein n=1 Tax=Bdellovibrio TaxID=958 RepID=UPI0025439D51|nr:outer membrane lipoprotein-sorting protein [Bdellovibrio sp. 22V]WII71021.1 outer membrane lipoprotein-sorting protein [Bdellovibrio sp. 22V]